MMRQRLLVFLGGVCLVVACGWMIYREYANLGDEVIMQKESPAAALGAAALILDSDGDGLKDWEEELWRTNPSVPDTYGDGTGDAEEIKKGRNPVVAGPDDLLDPVLRAAKVNSESKKEVLDTERLARELFATYLSTRRQGMALTEAEIQSLVGAAAASVPERASEKFTEKDLAVLASEEERELRAYGNALGAVFARPWPVRENELVIFERVLKDPNEETARLDVVQMTPIALAYGQLAKAIARVPLPAGALAPHLRAANAAAEISESIRGMSQAFDDPVRALASTARYLEAVPRFASALSELRTFFETHGVLFRENEAGYALWRVVGE